MNNFQIRAFNPQPEPPKPTWDFGIHGFNPQPEPPPFDVNGLVPNAGW